MVVKSLEEILGILKKDFIHFGSEKKKSLSLQSNLNDFIKAISYYRFSLSIHTKLGLLNLEYK